MTELHAKEGVPLNAQDNWLAETIAEQEEYLKRMRSCMDRVGRNHAFRRHSRPGESEAISRCVTCGVTETRHDYTLLLKP